MIAPTRDELLAAAAAPNLWPSVWIQPHLLDERREVVWSRTAETLALLERQPDYQGGQWAYLAGSSQPHFAHPSEDEAARACLRFLANPTTGETVPSTSVKFITLGAAPNTKDFELPYANLFRDLPEESYRALVEEIRANGILDPIYTYGDAIVDGQHRARAAAELELPLEQIPLRPAPLNESMFDPDTAAETVQAQLRSFAIRANTIRRQISAEERVELGRVLRADGMSNREIAAVLGVDERTVRRDLADEGCPGAANAAPGQVDERRERVQAAHSAGESIRKLAAAEGVSKSTIEADLKAPARQTHAERATDRHLGSVHGPADKLGSTTKPVGGSDYFDSLKQTLEQSGLGAELRAASAPSHIDEEESARAEQERIDEQRREAEAEQARFAEQQRKEQAEADRQAQREHWKRMDEERDARLKAAEAEAKAAVAHLRIAKVAADRWEVFETLNGGAEELAGLIDQGSPDHPGNKGQYTAQVVIRSGETTFDLPLRNGDFGKVFFTQKDILPALASARNDPAKFLATGLRSEPAPWDRDESPRPQITTPEEAKAQASEKPPKKPRGPHAFSDIDFSKWKDYDELLTDSFWDPGPRAKGPGRKGDYHGNFIPQIPDLFMRRFTQAGDVVADLFLGGGTSMVESVRLGRHFLGFDLQQQPVEDAQALFASLPNPQGVHVGLHCGDSSGALVAHTIRQELERLERSGLDHIFLHPPYWRCIRFASEHAEVARDLSWTPTVKEFLDQFRTVIWRSLPLLKPGKFFTLVMGDVWADSEWVTLGSDCKDVIKQVGGAAVKLKGHVVKKIQGNEKGAGKGQPLKRYRSLWNGTFEFSHEHIYVFQKVSEVAPVATDSEEDAE